MTLWELLRSGREDLLKAGIEAPEVDSMELLLFVTGLSREEYLLKKGEEAAAGTEIRFRELIEKRAEHVPLQHLTGTAWFYGYPFSVGPEVLIPRFDTEVLVEKVLRETDGYNLSVLDLCTGSGIIGIVIMLEGKYSSVTATDISPEALATARKNADALKAPVRFLESDLFENISGRYDVIVSNPPYIAPEVIETLSPEVKDHDPRLALFGGDDGLRFYRSIAREGKDHIEKGGRLVLEIGEEQAEAVSAILNAEGYSEITVTKDLAGLDRVVSARFL